MAASTVEQIEPGLGAARRPKVAFVVQRYGAEVNGGAETLCRQVAEHLASSWDVEVLTSCSREYVSRFENDYPEGFSSVNSIPVRRFAVEHRRSEAAVFGLLDEKVRARRASAEEDERWLREVGPYCPGLRNYLQERTGSFDLIIFFTYLYWTTNSVLPFVRERAVLAPTAHDEPPITARPFDTLFQLPRALLFLTPEEEAFVRRRTEGKMARAHVIGAGIDSAPAADPARFRAQLGLDGAYVLYAGRVQKEKGCDAMFEDYLGLPTATKERFPLVVLGKAAMQIPDSPYVRYGGFVSDELKRSAFAGASLVLIPSPYESLSLVALEAWSSGIAVLVNGDSEVLKGQCRRSQGGLWYHGPDEFREAFLWLTAPDHELHLRALAQNGRAYVEQSHRWDVVVGKYRGILEDAAGAPGAICAQ